ncbi:hypothetical protein PENTCL1PPCAC_29514, partial [Pristionchus entomophagus]
LQMFPLLPYTHIHTTEQLPLHLNGERHSKIDLTIRRNWNRHRLVLLDFLCSDCYSGTHYRLRLDDNTYINLPDDDPTLPAPITLTDFYRELRDFISRQEEILAELAEDGEAVIVKLFPSSPLLFLERLDDDQMMEIIKESTNEDQGIESTLRDQFRLRWSRLAAQMLHASPKAELLRRTEVSEVTYVDRSITDNLPYQKVKYITALRHGLHKSPALTVPRPSRVKRRSISATR